MKNILSIILLIGFPVVLFAQTEQPMELSLKQAVEMGLKNRYDQKADAYSIDRAQNQINKSKKAWIPDVKFNGDVSYIPEIDPLYIPKNALGNDEAKLSDIGAHNEMSFGLSLTQPIVKPGIQTDIKISKTERDLAQEQHRGNAIAIKNAISIAYYQVLLKKMQYTIARDENARFKQYMKMVEGRYKNGVMIKNDYRRARLDYKNAQVKETTAQQNYEIAKTQLKHQINLPETTQVSLTDSIEKMPLEERNITVGEATENRTEIKQMELQKRSNKLNIKKAKKYALPTVSLVAGYAQSYKNKNFHYDQTKWWAPHSFVGLNISVPLTGNLVNKNKIKDYKLQQEQLELTEQQKKSDVRFEVNKTQTDLHNALSNMASAQENYDLSQEIYKNQQEQFSIGSFHYSDLLDTEKSMHQAEANYIQEVYKYLMAKIAYQKALGEL